MSSGSDGSKERPSLNSGRCGLGEDLLERGRHPSDALLHVALARKAEARPEADLIRPKRVAVVRPKDRARGEDDLVGDEGAEEALERGCRRQVRQTLGLDAEEDWRKRRRAEAVSRCLPRGEVFRR
jgi:hypothetical protein